MTGNVLAARHHIHIGPASVVTCLPDAYGARKLSTHTSLSQSACLSQSDALQGRFAVLLDLLACSVAADVSEIDAYAPGALDVLSLALCAFPGSSMLFRSLPSQALLMTELNISIRSLKGAWQALVRQCACF